jgi:hypothetical protein
VYAHYNLACTLSLIKESLRKRIEKDEWKHLDSEEWLLINEYKLYMKGFFANETYAVVMLGDEIYDHLTLTFLQNKDYIEKSRNDFDLQFIQKQTRFSNLITNISTGRMSDFYGRWFTNDHRLSIVYYMLDQRFCLLKYNGDYSDIGYPFFPRTGTAYHNEDYITDPSDESGYVLANSDVAELNLYDIINEDFFLIEGHKIYDPPAFASIDKMTVSTFKIHITWYSKFEFSINTDNESIELIRFYNPHAIYFSQPYISPDNAVIPERTLISLLRIATMENNYAMIQNILSYADDSKKLIDSSKALLYAASYGQSEAVYLLIKKGADIMVAINGISLLAAAVDSGNKGLFYKLYNEYKDTLAATHEQKEKIYRSIDYGNEQLQEEVKILMDFKGI